MRRSLAAGIVLLAAGCGGPRAYSAPAPEGALRCALEEAEELGYERMSGEPGEEYVRVSQRVEPPPSLDLRDRPPPPGPDDIRPVARDAPYYNQLVLRERGGALRIEVLQAMENGEIVGGEVPIGSDADGHAQIILAACTA